MLRFRPHLWIALAILALAGPALAQSDRVLRLEAIETQPSDAGLAAAVGDLVGLWPGQEIDAEDLRAARRTIARSGWFETVEVYTRAGSRPGALILRVEGELDDSFRFETGFGHDPLDAWYLNLIGLRVHHAMGPASTARLNLQTGLRRSYLRFELEARRVAGTGMDILIDAAGGAEQWNVYDRDRLYAQDIERFYARLGVRIHPTRSTSLAFWAGRSSARPLDLERHDRDQPDPPAELAAAFAESDRERYVDTRLDFVIDRRDRAEPWRRALWALARVEVSRPDDGPTFVRSRASLRAAAPLPGHQGLALRGDLMWTDPGTPYHLRPIFGGNGTVRGFRDASLSGGSGARAIGAAGLEWRVPLLHRGESDARVHGVLFSDTGRYVDAAGDWGPWSTSVGWGVRVRLPWVERIALDVGIPLTPTATGDPFWVHGSLGFGF